MVLDSIITSIETRLKRDSENGQGLAEYALILGLIACVAIIAMMYLGGQISERLSQVGNAV